MKKFPSLLGHSCSNFSNKNKPLLPVLPLLYSPSCFSAQMEDKVQRSNLLTTFFQGTQGANSLCRQNGISDLVLCLWVQEEKKYRSLCKHKHWKFMVYSAGSCLQNGFALYDILYQGWRSQNMILQFCFLLAVQKREVKKDRGRASG